MDIDKNIKISPGVILSTLVVVVPSVAWTLSFDFSGMDSIEVLSVSIMKTGAFGGMAMFAWSLVLSGRYVIFDKLFRGLDKMYVAHRFFGTASLVLLLLHPLGYTLSYLYDYGATDLAHHFLGFKNLAFTLGRVSLYGLSLIGLWSIYIKSKYETFILVHRLLGVLFVIGAIHAFMSGSSSVIMNDSFMYGYMLLLAALGSLTFIQYSFLSDVLHRHFIYHVSSVVDHPGGTWEIRILPKFRFLNFRPGQFAYLSFQTLDKHNYHPFTIASSSRSSELVFYIKELGDLTSEIGTLKEGDHVNVKGPYGGFTFDDRRFPKQLWLAGGIGITPFLAAARSLPYARRNLQIELVYMTSKNEEAFAIEELEQIEKDAKGFNVTLVTQEDYGLQSIADLDKQLNGIDDFSIYLCGPPGMLNAYSKQIKEMGLEDQLHFEEFDY